MVGLLALSIGAVWSILTLTKQDIVGASGFILTAWGLLVSLAGFGVTWWQLARTQRAATAAREAVVRLKRAFSSLDVISELRSAREAARQAILDVDAQRWPEAANGFDRTRESLNKIAASAAVLDATDVERTRDFVTDCIDGNRSSQALRNDPQAPISLETLTLRLKELDGFLIETEIKIKADTDARQ